MFSCPHTVVIVDDDPHVLGSLHSLLRSVGITSRCFASAETLLARTDAGVADCFVIDIHMPGMTGIELLHALSASGRRRPAIMMTAHLTEETRQKAIAAGATAIFVKPIDPDAFLDVVTRAIAKRSGRP